MTFTLTVPEAAATPDTIQFKLVIDNSVKRKSVHLNNFIPNPFFCILPNFFFSGRRKCISHLLSNLSTDQLDS